MAAAFQEAVVASEVTRIICLELDPSMSLVTSAATSSLDSFGSLRILRLILTRIGIVCFPKAAEDSRTPGRCRAIE
jgi:hypothetical protein